MSEIKCHNCNYINPGSRIACIMCDVVLEKPENIKPLVPENIKPLVSEKCEHQVFMSNDAGRFGMFVAYPFKCFKCGIELKAKWSEE